MCPRRDKGQFVSDGSVGAQVYASGAGKRAVPGAEARFVAGLDVRAEARTYLRSKNNGKSETRLLKSGVPHSCAKSAHEWATRSLVLRAKPRSPNARDRGHPNPAEQPFGAGLCLIGDSCLDNDPETCDHGIEHIHHNLLEPKPLQERLPDARIQDSPALVGGGCRFPYVRSYSQGTDFYRDRCRRRATGLPVWVLRVCAVWVRALWLLRLRILL